MNKNQKLLTYCGLALFGITVLNAPWESKLVIGDFTKTYPIRYSAIWEPPGALNDGNYTTVTLKSDSLLAEWAAIAVVYACAFAMVKSPVNEVNTKAERMNEASKQIDAAERLRRDSASRKEERVELLLQGAASTGNAMAQYNLAIFYYNAKTMPNHEELAFKWETLAAQHGYAPSQFDIGLAYAIGKKVPRDHAMAFEWYYKAAMQGYSEAQELVSQAYEDGRGVQLDLVQAYKWLKVAIDKGKLSFNPIWGDLEHYDWDTAPMREHLGRLAGKMTPEQIAEGQRLCNEFVPDHK